MSNFLAVWLLLPSAVLVNATPIIPRTTSMTDTGAATSPRSLTITRSLLEDPKNQTHGPYKLMNGKDGNSDILNSAFERPPHYDSDQWALLAAKIVASIAALIVIFIIVFFLHRRHIRGRRRRIGEMMGLGIKRNEMLLHKASKHYRAASGNSAHIVQSHPRQHAHRWRFSVVGNSRQERMDEETGMRRGVAGVEVSVERSR
jgi:hypothetical protein